MANQVFCDNNCGRPVLKEGTCIECWAVIDAAKNPTAK